MRRHHRYATSIPCTLKPRAGGQLSGTVTNISAGGAAFVGGAGLSDGPALLDISFYDEALVLPCRVRHAREVWGRATLHLQFGNLSDAQHEALDHLLGEIARSAFNVTDIQSVRLARSRRSRRVG